RKLAEVGIQRLELGREKFEQRVWEWKAQSGDTITRQMVRLGDSCDWSRERFTLAHFGLGHGNGAHAPDEYHVIEFRTHKIQGLDGAARSHVEYLYELTALS